MNNMLADAMVDAMKGWRSEYGSATLITFEMNVKPDVKKFRPGMAMDLVTVEFACVGPDRILITVTRAGANAFVIGAERHEATWDGARHFLRGLFANLKPFDFRRRDPFFTVTRDEGHKQTV